MQILKTTTDFDFMGRRKIAVFASLAFIAISIVSLATRGLNFGIDFTGGVLIEVAYEGPADLPAIRSGLNDSGFDSAQVQNFGTSRDVLIRLLPQEGSEEKEIRDQVMAILRESGEVSLRRSELVGPQVGKELTEQGGLAMMFALLMIMAYIWLRFQWKFSVGAVAALVHDVILTLGFFSVLQLPFDLSVLAAVLAVIGYSLNDTIVVFDRIRENFLTIRKTTPLVIMNSSINQMLARTLVTSFTTLVVLVALYVLGGEAIRPFSTALIVGIVVGTYSSIYVAGTTTLALDVTTVDLMPPQAGPDDDGMP